jgi:hypothetical protein
MATINITFTVRLPENLAVLINLNLTVSSHNLVRAGRMQWTNVSMISCLANPSDKTVFLPMMVVVNLNSN